MVDPSSTRAPIRSRKLATWERRKDERVPAVIEKWSRSAFVFVSVLGFLLAGLATWWSPWATPCFVPVAVFTIVGIRDIRQTRHTILRNFPVLGHLRYYAESMRPELRQYFVESDSEENPYSREKRSLIYQRAKGMLDTQAFGTRRSVDGIGYEWITHSLEPKHPAPSTARVTIGEGRCAQPYSSSLFNISAMSYGALSANATRALNAGANAGQFFHNTGEGAISSHHLDPGGDLVWQIGTGYFGCRDAKGQFDLECFRDKASLDAVKMIEIKLSQGAKPAHGGILPGDKVTPEIAEIRGVEVGQTVASPPAHTAFEGPRGLLEFVTQLREASGGKPVGFKLCVGRRVEFLAICRAMLDTGLRPDFITVDGAEGGTGAAPLEFANSVGAPLSDGLSFVHNSLRATNLRDDLRIISAGKISSGFHIVRQLALGADLCNSARAMMFALGCIQALKCNNNKCPTGIATHEPRLVAGLVVEDKAARVANYHAKTIHSVLELVGAAGLETPADLRPDQIHRRISASEVRDLGELHPWAEPGCLLEGRAEARLQSLWSRTTSERFSPRPQA